MNIKTSHKRRTLSSIEAFWRQTKRSVKRPIILEIPSDLEAHYTRQRARSFKHRVALAGNVIVSAIILYALLGAVFESVQSIRIRDMFYAMVIQLAVIVLPRKTNELRNQQILALCTGLAPLLLLMHFGEIESDYFLLGTFVMRFLYPWNAGEAALAALPPYLGFGLTRYVTSVDEHMVFFISIFIVAGFQWTRERERKLNFILEAEAYEHREHIHEGLRMAAKLHGDIISGDIDSKELAARVDYEPMEELGGDYVKMASFGDGRTSIVLADVTGHGLSAALMVNRINAVVENIMNFRSAPSDSAAGLNRFVTKTFQGSGLLMSSIWAEFDSKNRLLKWSNFGHPPPILLSSATRTIQLLAGKTHLMGIQEIENPLEPSIQVEEGDLVIFYTDGLLELDREEGRMDLRTLVEILEAYYSSISHDIGADEMIDYLKYFVHSQRVGAPKDDLLLIVWEIR